MNTKPLISKCLAVGIILLFVGVTIAPAMAQNTEKQSASRGNWLYVGGSGPGNYTKIQDAIDNASDGDTVFVFDDSSPYYENVMVNKSITLFGENRETTIIDANGWGSPINLNTSFITICGFTVQNSGEHLIDSAGIVRDYYSSPFPQTCDNITITGNTIMNNNFGIYLSHSNNNSIHNNIITQNKMCGIDCAEGRSSNIKNNLITKNRVGIYLSNLYLFEITQNNINDNNKGIRLWFSYSNYISENSILNSSDTGIDFILSYNNRIHANNFINNTKDAFFKSAGFQVFGNRFVNNYWDSYIGVGPKKILGIYDMVLLSLAIGFFFIIFFNGYGFPEIPITWFDFDWHPARKPYDIPGMR